MLAHERGKAGLKSLPGRPFAMVNSSDPRFQEAFLCVVEPGGSRRGVGGESFMAVDKDKKGKGLGPVPGLKKGFGGAAPGAGGLDEPLPLHGRDNDETRKRRRDVAPGGPLDCIGEGLDAAFAKGSEYVKDPKRTRGPIFSIEDRQKARDAGRCGPEASDSSEDDNPKPDPNAASAGSKRKRDKDDPRALPDMPVRDWKPATKSNKNADLEKTLREEPEASRYAREYQESLRPVESLEEVARRAKLKVKLEKKLAAHKRARLGLDGGRLAYDPNDEDSDNESAASDPKSSPKGGRMASSGNTLATFKKGRTSAPEYNRLDLPPHAEFTPLPGVLKDWRTVMFLSGPPGCGKTMFTAEQMKLFKVLFPGRKIYGVCETHMEDDKSYKGLGIEQIPVDVLVRRMSGTSESVGGGSDGNDKFGMKKFFGEHGCLLVIDDWDSFPTIQRNAVRQLIQTAVNVGRKMLINLIVTSHITNNASETKSITEGCEYIVVFPRDTMARNLRVLGEKIGFPDDTMDLLANERSWVVFHKTQPKFIMAPTWVKFFR